jgi:hypothetical protein
MHIATVTRAFEQPSPEARILIALEPPCPWGYWMSIRPHECNRADAGDAARKTTAPSATRIALQHSLIAQTVTPRGRAE